MISFSHPLGNTPSLEYCKPRARISSHHTSHLSRVDQKIRLWDIRKARSQLHVFDQYHTSHSVSSSSPHTTATGGDPVSHSAPINSLTYTPDGLFLLSSAHDNTIRRWNAQTYTNTLINFGPHLQNSSFAPLFPAATNQHIIYPNETREIFVFELATGALCATFRGHFGKVSCVTIRDREYERGWLVSGGYDRNCLLWEWPGMPRVDEAKNRRGRKRRHVEVYAADDDDEDEWSDE